MPSCSRWRISLLVWSAASFVRWVAQPKNTDVHERHETHETNRMAPDILTPRWIVSLNDETLCFISCLSCFCELLPKGNIPARTISWTNCRFKYKVSPCSRKKS